MIRNILTVARSWKQQLIPISGREENQDLHWNIISLVDGMKWIVSSKGHGYCRNIIKKKDKMRSSKQSNLHEFIVELSINLNQCNLSVWDYQEVNWMMGKV